MGTASRNSDRPIGSVVKSRLDPRIASRNIGQKELSTVPLDGVAPFNDIGSTCIGRKNQEKSVLSPPSGGHQNIKIFAADV
jgi:hypothetical protein